MTTDRAGPERRRDARADHGEARGRRRPRSAATTRPPAAAPGPPTNTYSYLKAHVAGGAAAGLPDAVFRGLLAASVGVLPDGSLNLERVQLEPLFEDDDDFLTTCSHGDVDPATGLIADPTPPYKLYPANLNQIGPLGNPFVGLAP